MNGTQIQVRANQVREGDFLPGLDNGYVIEVEQTECSSFSGRYNVSLGELVVLTFNTSDGDEGYALLPEDAQVTITRGEA